MKRFIIEYFLILTIFNIHANQPDYTQQETEIRQKCNDLELKIKALESNAFYTEVMEEFVTPLVRGLVRVFFDCIFGKTSSQGHSAYCTQCHTHHSTCNRTHSNTYSNAQSANEKTLLNYKQEKTILLKQLQLIQANQEWAQLGCKD